MTKQEENRIKMALYDGATWKKVDVFEILGRVSHVPHLSYSTSEIHKTISYDIPDYYKDYEAVRQFIIKHFRYPNTQELWNIYRIHLDDIISMDLGISKLSVSFQFETTIASIEQMIEAIVKTID